MAHLLLSFDDLPYFPQQKKNSDQSHSRPTSPPKKGRWPIPAIPNDVSRFWRSSSTVLAHAIFTYSLSLFTTMLIAVPFFPTRNGDCTMTILDDWRGKQNISINILHHKLSQNYHMLPFGGIKQPQKGGSWLRSRHASVVLFANKSLGAGHRPFVV